MNSRKNNEKRFHNQLFGGDNDARKKADAKYYSITKSILAYYTELLLSQCKDGQVMEYGCGQSQFSYLLARSGADSVLGIDISDVAIEQANEKARREGLADKMKFITMDAEDLQLQDNSLDLICGNGIIHHLDLHKAYSELARVIKPDGTVVFTEPLGHNPFINLFRKLTPGIRTVDEHPLVMRDIALAKKYFGKVETRFFFLFTLFAIPFRKFSFFQRLVAVFDRMDKLWFALFPFARRYAWMAVIQLSRPMV